MNAEELKKHEAKIADLLKKYEGGVVGFKTSDGLGSGVVYNGEVHTLYGYYTPGIGLSIRTGKPGNKLITDVSAIERNIDEVEAAILLHLQNGNSLEGKIVIGAIPINPHLHKKINPQ